MTPSRRRKTKAEVLAFLAGHTPEVRAIAQKVRELVFEVAPDAFEQIDSPAHLLGYGFALTYKDTLCVITPLKSAVNLGFPRGVSLPDPAGLLTGTGKRARHVKLTQAEAVEQPAVRALLAASVEQLRGL